MSAAVTAIEYYLPESRLTNDDLARAFPEWTAQKIYDKTGIAERRIAAEGELSSDLALRAAERLFERGAVVPADVDFVLLCTQSPDYLLPTTACVLQERLGIPTTAGALDFNLGCSGFVYGLGIAKGLVESGQATKVLLLTAETYSKFIRDDDRSVRTLFGDGAAATLVEAVPGGEGEPCLGPFVYGTDGRGAKNLIVESGGMRQPACLAPSTGTTAVGDPVNQLFMNGAEVFTFTLGAVPRAVADVLARAGLAMGDVDHFVFHQANRYMLDHLRKKIGIPEERFVVDIETVGNTVSATIPIALANAVRQGRVRPGDRTMVVGFGVGYSWAAAMLRWAGPAT